jgi:hypothetical protein
LHDAALFDMLTALSGGARGATTALRMLNLGTSTRRGAKPQQVRNNY